MLQLSNFSSPTEKNLNIYQNFHRGNYTILKKIIQFSLKEAESQNKLDTYGTSFSNLSYVLETSFPNNSQFITTNKKAK